MIKNSAAKIFIVGSLLFAANDAYANVYYKTTYNLGAGFNNVTEGGGHGTLEGFIMFDLNAAQEDLSNFNKTTTTKLQPVPAWITAASFTFTNTAGTGASFPTITKTLADFDGVFWQTANGNLSITEQNGTQFVDQMSRLAFTDPSGVFLGPTGGGVLGMQVHNDEFAMVSSVTEVVPGPLPLLGLVPLLRYFKKFKNKSYKL